MSVKKEELNEKLLKVFNKEDVSLKLKAATSPEECYSIVKPYLPDMSMDEFVKSSAVINDFIQENTNASGDLALDELDEVAGGGILGDIGTFLGGAATATLVVVGVT